MNLDILSSCIEVGTPHPSGAFRTVDEVMQLKSTLPPPPLPPSPISYRLILLSPFAYLLSVSSLVQNRREGERAEAAGGRTEDEEKGWSFIHFSVSQLRFAHRIKKELAFPAGRRQR
jgi:hypothetical protein